MPEFNRRGEPVVLLYAKSRTMAKKVTDWFMAEGVDLSIVDTAPPRGVQGQILLHGCALNSSVERAAARIGGLACVVPEALDWVLQKCQNGEVDVMVDYGWVKTGLL